MSRSARFSGRPSTGRRAEDLAAAELQRQGLRIIARNWRRPEGELDLVADDHGLCVFVEVRSRTGVEQGDPLESITPRKRAQVIRAARMFIDSETVPATGYRFDVVGVTFFDDGREPVLTHVPAAFEVSS
jgi:putative endonuclease